MRNFPNFTVADIMTEEDRARALPIPEEVQLAILPRIVTKGGLETADEIGTWLQNYLAGLGADEAADREEDEYVPPSPYPPNPNPHDDPQPSTDGEVDGDGTEPPDGDWDPYDEWGTDNAPTDMNHPVYESLRAAINARRKFAGLGETCAQQTSPYAAVLHFRSKINDLISYYIRESVGPPDNSYTAYATTTILHQDAFGEDDWLPCTCTADVLFQHIWEMRKCIQILAWRTHAPPSYNVIDRGQIIKAGGSGVTWADAIATIFPVESEDWELAGAGASIGFSASGFYDVGEEWYEITDAEFARANIDLTGTPPSTYNGMNLVSRKVLWEGETGGAKDGSKSLTVTVGVSLSFSEAEIEAGGAHKYADGSWTTGEKGIGHSCYTSNPGGSWPDPGTGGDPSTFSTYITVSIHQAKVKPFWRYRHNP